MVTTTWPEVRPTLPLSARWLLSLGLAATLGAALAVAILSAVGLLPSAVHTEAQPEDTIAQIYRQASPGVVSVVDLGQPGVQSPNYALGSGFVVDLAGHVVTCHHVIEGISNPGIVLSDGTTYPASLVGDDPADDLAVLKALIPSAKLQPLALGDSSTVQVGQRVIAIGSPFGLQQTLTSGDVSFVGRRIQLPSKHTIDGGIQTDASLNPGNSGGPLLDTRGEVVGVNTSIIAKGIGNGEYGSIGVGFAIPSSLVKRLLPEMISGDLRARPWLGVTARDFKANSSDQAAESPSDAATEGAILVNVLPGARSDAAHLRGSAYLSERTGERLDDSGDVITEIDGVAVRSVGDLASRVAHSDKQVGDVVTLQVVRQGRVLEVVVRLTARDDRQADVAGAI